MTVQTPGQEAHRSTGDNWQNFQQAVGKSAGLADEGIGRGKAVTINFNFNGVVSSSAGVKKLIEQSMRELGTTSINDWARNDRANLVLNG